MENQQGRIMAVNLAYMIRLWFTRNNFDKQTETMQLHLYAISPYVNMVFASCDCIPFPRKLMKRKLPLVPARFIQQRNNVDTRRKVPSPHAKCGAFITYMWFIFQSNLNILYKIESRGESHYLCCTQLKSTELQFIFYL